MTQNNFREPPHLSGSDPKYAPCLHDSSLSSRCRYPDLWLVNGRQYCPLIGWYRRNSPRLHFSEIKTRPAGIYWHVHCAVTRNSRVGSFDIFMACDWSVMRNSGLLLVDTVNSFNPTCDRILLVSCRLSEFRLFSSIETEVIFHCPKSEFRLALCFARRGSGTGARSKLFCSRILRPLELLTFFNEVCLKGGR